MNVHTLDPVTSYEAAELMDSTGTRTRHLDLVMTYVVRHPGMTASEYARLTGLDEVEVRRRLNDAKNRNVALQDGARRAAGKKVREMQWWPVEAQGALL